MADTILPITMPKWGIEMTEGTIVAWTATEGQQVGRGDPLLEVETDKIVNTVEAPLAGRLCRIVSCRRAKSAPSANSSRCSPRATSATLKSTRSSRASNPPTCSRRSPEPPPMRRPGSREPPPPPSPSSRPAPPAASTAPLPAVSGEVRVSPATRRVAADLGVDLSQVRGTGRNGRITAEDVEASAAQMAAGGSIPSRGRR